MFAAFPSAQDLQFDLYYLPFAAISKEIEEIELRDEDMEVGFYDGVQLDLRQVLRSSWCLPFP